MKSHHHLQRIPSWSVRAKEMALPSRGPGEDGEGCKCPSADHLTSISFVMGELKTLSGLSSLRVHLKIILTKCIFILSLVQVTAVSYDLLCS